MSVRRLITHGIIYSNARRLSKRLAYKETLAEGHGAALLKHLSPVAWPPLNFYGRYDFSHRPTRITREAIV